MTAYFALLLLLAVVAAVISLSQSKNAHAQFVVIAGTALVLLMAVRATTVGTDIPEYQAQYEASYYRPDEPGFSLLMRWCAEIGLSFQQFLALLSLIVVVPVAVLIYRYSKTPFLSFYLHVTIGFFAMSMSGLRQAVAVAITITAFLVLMKGRRIGFLVLVSVAFTIHNSAIIFFPLVLVSRIRLTRRAGVVLMIIMVAVASQTYLVGRVVNLLKLEKYDSYLTGELTSLNLVVLVVAGLIPLACLFLWPRDGVPRQSVAGVDASISIPSILLAMAILNFGVVALSVGAPVMTRLTYYFVTFNALLVPNVIASYPQKDMRRLAGLACFALPLIQFILVVPGDALGIDDYRTFWS